MHYWLISSKPIDFFAFSLHSLKSLPIIYHLYHNMIGIFIIIVYNINMIFVIIIL